MLAVTIMAFISFTVFAGTLSAAKVTISDSRAGQTGINHDFSFTTATTGTIASVTFQYCTTAAGACSTPNGLVTTSGSQGSLTGLGASTTNFASNGNIILTVTSPISVSSGTAIVIPYSNITNPTSINSSFFIKITTKDGNADTIDSTTVAFATLGSTSIAVSADVGATFSVSLAAVTSGFVNGATINLGSTTAATIPFSSLSTGSTKIAAHDITVTSNSSGGYVITVKSDNPPLADGLNNNIDKFTGTNATPSAWLSPAGSSPNANTGFFGYTTESSSLCTGSANRFTVSGGNKWAGPETTAYEIACNTGSVMSGETTRIGWQAEVNNLQPAGSYTGTVILVTTPTY